MMETAGSSWLNQQQASHLSADAVDQWVVAQPSFVEARDFYLRLAHHAGGPVVVLEAGSGQLTRRIHDCGGDVTVVDPAPPRSETDQYIRIVSKWESFSLGRPSSLVVAPFGLLNSYWDTGRLKALFENVFGQLAVGGRFAFDLRRFAASHRDIPVLTSERGQPDGSSRLLWETWSHQRASDRFECRLGLEEVTPGGAVLRKSYSRLLMGHIAPSLIKALAAQAGFTVEGGFGGFDMEVLGEEPPLQVWVLGKPAGGSAS
jgi:hypothetical protein